MEANGKEKEPASPKKREGEDSPHNPATEEKMSGTSEVEGTDIPDGYKVHIGGIPKGVKKEELTEELEKVGDFSGLRIVHSKRKTKGHAFVYFKNKAFSAEDMKRLNQITLHGNKIEANESKTNGKNENKKDIMKEQKVDKARKKDVIYTIGDKEGHIKFITELRKKLCELKEGSDDIFEGDCAHPLLVAKPSGTKPVRWIHVELRAIDEKGNEMKTTLAVRKDNLYVKGFMNQDEQWFELPGNAANDDMKLPGSYKAKELKGWDVSYRGLMNLSNKNQVKKTLESMRLCKAFAVKAVRILSRYRIWDAGKDPMETRIDENLTRLSLAGLLVIICESARMNPFLDTIAGGWDGGTGLTSRLLDIMWDWGSMSAALLKWKKTGKWPIKSNHGLGTALASINLVLDSTDVTGTGPTWVEISDVSSNCPVTSVTVIDEGKCRNTIYKHETKTEQVQQGETQQEIVPLKLTVKGRRISGYEYFSMEVVFPPFTGSGDSITKKFKWDCRKQDGEVTELVPRAINLDHGRKIKVTYLVMNNVVEAKLEVKLRLKGGREDSAESWLKRLRGDLTEISASGEIVAWISGFQDHQIVLFRTEGDEKVSVDLEKSILMRSSVSVPAGKGLHIDMAALDITEAPGDRSVKKPSRLSYDFGTWTPIIMPSPEDDQVVDDYIEVKVNITWPAKEETVEREPDVVFIIGDKKKFTSSIEELRDVLADHPDPEDVLDGYTGEEPLDTIGDHRVLACRPPPFGQTPRWIHVKLQVVDGEERKEERKEVNAAETSSMTLALRDDECYGVGFMNRNGVWYDLGLRGGDKQLPPEYYSVLLDWGYHLCSDVPEYEVISKSLGTIWLGKVSAMAAVRTLSRYPDVEEDAKPMLALTVLLIMICESARFNPIFRSIKAGWDTGLESTKQLFDYARSWRQISVDLLCWKDNGHNSKERWPQYSAMGINCPIDALSTVCLVFNSDLRIEKIYKEYTIKDEEWFSALITELRCELVHPDDREGILDGHPDPESVSTFNNAAVLYRWPARLIQIKLQLANEDTSVTLSIRDSDVRLLGFMNHEGVWYEAWNWKGDGLPAEFNPKPLMWGSYKDMLPDLNLSKHYVQWLSLNMHLLADLNLSKHLPSMEEEDDVAVSAWGKVREKLRTECLDKHFAMKAVRTLSRYPQVLEGDCPRLALAGLTIMLCESARLKPVHDHIRDCWDKDIRTGFSNQVSEYVQGSDLISDTLRTWKNSGYRRWPGGNDDAPNTPGIGEAGGLRGMGIHSPKDALDLVYLIIGQ
uniref:RRM domain-containing protein n=1 Tax=Hordeum vulgare subsp. vulgare TaxID=112509 RepID=A0A8I6XSU5_HORVV